MNTIEQLSKGRQKSKDASFSVCHFTLYTQLINTSTETQVRQTHRQTAPASQSLMKKSEVKKKGKDVFFLSLCSSLHSLYLTNLNASLGTQVRQTHRPATPAPQSPMYEGTCAEEGMDGGRGRLFGGVSYALNSLRLTVTDCLLPTYSRSSACTPRLGKETLPL